MIANALKRPQDSELVVVCLVPFGEWKGHPNGEQRYDKAEAEAIIARFNESYGVNGKPMPIDYGHDSLYQGNAPASGWVWDVFIGDEPDENGRKIPGVYGKVQWTPKAAEGIKAGEYSGAISPVIQTGGVDPVTGKEIAIELYNGGLTNMPFMLDKMPQATANTIKVFNNGRNTLLLINGGQSMDPKAMLDAVIQALGLPAGASPEDALNLLKKIVEFVGLMPGAPAGGIPAEPALEGMTAQVNSLKANSAALSEVAKLLGCEPKDVLAKVAAMQNTNDGAPTRDEFTALKTQLAERNADDLLRENARKVKPDRRDFWRNKAIVDLEGTKQVFAEMQDILPADPPEPTQKSNTAEPDAELLKIWKMTGVTKEEVTEYLNSKKGA